jgi:hypothetical protein
MLVHLVVDRPVRTGLDLSIIRQVEEGAEADDPEGGEHEQNQAFLPRTQRLANHGHWHTRVDALVLRQDSCWHLQSVSRTRFGSDALLDRPGHFGARASFNLFVAPTTDSGCPAGRAASSVGR